VPKRRRAHRYDFPEDSQGLVDCLVEQRLLLVDGRDSDGGREVFIEVTHEAVLRYWPLLSLWLEEEASNLHLLDNLRSATQDWLKNGRAPDWLVHNGRRLASAKSLLVNPLYSASFPPETTDYLAACEKNQQGGDREEFEQRIALVEKELGSDIFQKLEELEGRRAGGISASTGGLEDEIYQRKKKFLDQPMWHPSTAVHRGTADARGDYGEIWEFPCCGKQVMQDAEPSQDRADGCERK
jgi:hypothetical protein